MGLARAVLRHGSMAARLLRTAYLAALFLACDAGSSVVAGESTSTPESDPKSNGGAGGDSPTPHAVPSDAGATADGEVPVDPGPPHVQLIGRFDTTDPAGVRCAYAGCRIVARFDGTHVSAKLKEQ